MLHLPELVELVVLFFSGEKPEKESSLAACTQVSHAWRQAFIPLYWRHINDALTSRLGRTLKSLWFERSSGHEPQSREESLRRRAYLRQYLHHVRHLHLAFPWTLDLFLEWSITHQHPTCLLVLTFQTGGNLNRCFTLTNESLDTGFKAGIFCPGSENHTGQEDMDVPDASSLYDGSLSPQEREALLSRVPRWTLRVPRRKFAHYSERERLSRGIWQLIQSSPELTHLNFGASVYAYMCNPDLKGDESGNDPVIGPIVKQPAGALLLAHVLKSHKNLVHFEPNLPEQEEEVLEVMAQEQRRGCSSIQSYSTSDSYLPLSTDRATWDLVRGRLLNTGMRRLSLGNYHVLSSRVRFFLEIFPNLEELHLFMVHSDGKAQERDILVNTSLRRLSISYKAFGLAACRVQFEGLKEFRALRMGRDIWDLNTLLKWSMPHCEIFHAGIGDAWRPTERVQDNSIPSDIQALERGGFLKETELPVRELTLILRPFHTLPKIMGAIRWMPFLTRVKFQGNRGSEVLEMLARYCTKLQHLEVQGTRGLTSQALCRILRTCKDLKSLQGQDLVLRAIDVIQSQPWVCPGMQEFSCPILGVPRLTVGEEGELSRSDMGLEEVKLEEAAEREKWELDTGEVLGIVKREDAIEDDEEKDDPRLQRKRRIAQLCQRRKLLVRRQRSLEVQCQIFSVLAKWTKLEHLDLSNCSSNYKKSWIYRRKPQTLEWSFDSGLKQLATMKGLRLVYINELEHRAGEDELQWMKDNWPRLWDGPLRTP